MYLSGYNVHMMKGHFRVRAKAFPKARQFCISDAPFLNWFGENLKSKTYRKHSVLEPKCMSYYSRVLARKEKKKETES
jgi:hypothetical protein